MRWSRAGRRRRGRLYVNVLGGHRHLAWKLGEMARGLRILQGFDPCPDRWALGWYLRAMGELESAYEQNPLPYFRADIRLLQGRLPEVEAEGDPGRIGDRRVPDGPDDPAAGRPAGLRDPDGAGPAVPGAGRPGLAGRGARGHLRDDRLERRPGAVPAVPRRGGLPAGRSGEHGPVARRRGPAGCCIPARWSTCACITWSAARIARRDGDTSVAQSAVDEGLHVARHVRLPAVPGRAPLRAGRAATAPGPATPTRCGRPARPTSWPPLPTASSSGAPRRPATCSAVRCWPAAASTMPVGRSRRPSRSVAASATSGPSRPRRCCGRFVAEPPEPPVSLPPPSPEVGGIFCEIRASIYLNGTSGLGATKCEIPAIGALKKLRS